MKRITMLLGAGLLILCSMVWAAVPQLINFQGILRDGSGNPVANGSYSVMFTIYDLPGSGATALWSETQSVTTVNGLFTVLLGVGPIPLDYSIFNDSTRWLGITVSPPAPEMTPRQRLSSVGYSHHSSEWTSAAGNLFRLNGNVGIGTAPLGEAKLDVLIFGSDPFTVKGIRSQVENSSSGDAIGGYFATSTAGTGPHYGVFANGNGSAGNAYGGYFSGSSSGGTSYGVYGSGNNYGLYAQSGQTGVYGEGFLYGVYGTGGSAGGIFESTGGGSYGVQGIGGTYGVIGYSDVNNGYGVYGSDGSNPLTYAGYFSGDVAVVGDFVVTGIKAATVKTDNGEYRLLYAQESPENWFEDFGTVQLVNGRALVNIEPIFAQTVNTTVPYHVFLTPEGDCRGLYVANKSQNSFELRELQNGKSELSVSYRIVAKRKGYEDVRLAKLTGKTPEEVQAEQVKMEAERKLQEEQRAKMEQERKRLDEKAKEIQPNK